jgi:hypothetical protein
MRLRTSVARARNGRRRLASSIRNGIVPGLRHAGERWTWCTVQAGQLEKTNRLVVRQAQQPGNGALHTAIQVRAAAGYPEGQDPAVAAMTVDWVGAHFGFRFARQFNPADDRP